MIKRCFLYIKQRRAGAKREAARSAAARNGNEDGNRNRNRNRNGDRIEGRGTVIGTGNEEELEAEENTAREGDKVPNLTNV